MPYILSRQGAIDPNKRWYFSNDGWMLYRKDATRFDSTAAALQRGESDLKGRYSSEYQTLRLIKSLKTHYVRPIRPPKRGERRI